MKARQDVDAGETGHFDSGWRASICGVRTATFGIRLLSLSLNLVGRGRHTPAAREYRDNRSAAMRTQANSNTGRDVEGGPIR